MSDLGALLRKAREQRGYTLDDIQDATKIRKRYLEAIETGDYKVLPGSFYVRAFVKTYAETVGLDAEEVLRLYQKELPKPSSSESAQPVEPLLKSSRRGSGQHSDRWGKVSVTLLMWLFPILIVAVIYVYLSQNHNKAPKEISPGPISTETASPTAPSSASPSAPASPPATESASPTPSAVTLTLTGTVRGVKQYDVSPSTGAPHKLQIQITGRCWVGVNENNSKGKSLLGKEYTSTDVPQTVSFDLTAPLYVSVGRADNATVTVDGTPVDDGDIGGRVRFLFSPASAQ